MKRKIDSSSNVRVNEAEAYIDFVKLNKAVILFRNWAKNKNTLINNPCDKKSSSMYSIAKLVNNENPLPLMMPGVFFDDSYCSNNYDSWEELYLNDDLFISLENLHHNNPRAFSLETLFLTNKYNGFLRTNLRYDDRQLMAMSAYDQERFLTQLKERYPSYYKEYLEAQPSKDELSQEITTDKLNRILDAVEVMLVLSCHKGGLRSTSLPNSLTDLLSAYGYELLIQALSDNLSNNEMEELKQLWAKNIRYQSEKTVQDLLDSALSGDCTTTLGLYWLGLLKEFRPKFSFTLNEDFLSKTHENFVANNPIDSANISKSFFTVYIKENMRYIATEMLTSAEEHLIVNNSRFY
ncbi:hypothetical protein [Legionella fallonii]|uniref:Uncharacterized protein n=1 Tax=Legionella fallonii LLAP-10 TaxID=1212491 RepID=A0A098G5K2_9GAMM|nr:hypothetical protein [Legionella fallonii]CEG57256.1 protein of unknown function [Legionella fallonii LLAP-10]